MSLPAVLVFVVWLGGAVAALGQGGGRAQGAPPPPRPLSSGRPSDLGRVEGSTYTNDYFGISFDVPAGWTVHDMGALRQIEENAKKVFRDEQDPQLRQQLEAAVERTTPLLSASKFPPAGTPRPFNATLVCAAERIPTAVVKTPADYYRLTLHSLRLTQELDVQVVEPFRAKTIGGTAFGVYTIRLAFNLGVTLQKHLVMVEGPYVFGLVVAYTDEADAGVFDRVVASVRVAGRRKAVTR